MDADEIKAMYRDFCIMPVTVRRYGSVSAGYVPVDYAALGHFRLYGASELTANVRQGDAQVIIRADSLDAVGFPHPLTASDKIVWGGREMAVEAPGERRALNGTLIAYDLQARG